MLLRLVVPALLLLTASAFMCSSINIGSDVKNTKDVVNAGVVSGEWPDSCLGQEPD